MQERKSDEELVEEILNIKERNVLLELPTGYGKSKIALDVVAKRAYLRWKVTGRKPKILIMYYRKVQKETWKEQILHWGYKDMLPSITFSAYASFHKQVADWDFIIFDECHHLTDLCFSYVRDEKFHCSNAIFLSATLDCYQKQAIAQNFPGLRTVTVSVREAIESNVLPDPTILLLPIKLDSIRPIHTYIKRPRGSKVIQCNFANRWSAMKDRTAKVVISCTAAQYYFLLNEDIDYLARQMHKGNDLRVKNRYLRLCGDRLTWLSNQKIEYVNLVQRLLKNERTITFCNSIEQTELLGRFPINSKSKDSEWNLSQFNDGKIDHITACNMLNEGVNLVNCRVGIYANLNSSNLLIKQRLGRLLRHRNPLIIIPYYIDTREQELVNKMKEDYNPSLIHTLDHLDLLKQFIQ